VNKKMGWFEKRIDNWIKKHWGEEYVKRSEFEKEVQAEILDARQEEQAEAKMKKALALENQERKMLMLQSIKTATLKSKIYQLEYELGEWENKKDEIEMQAIANKDNLQAINNFIFEIQQVTRTIPEDSLKLTGRIADFVRNGTDLSKKIDNTMSKTITEIDLLR